jgi:phosphate uptake regulator
MKRKVVLQGGVALTVALPIKWAKIHNIKKGDEINLIQKDKKLEIYPSFDENDGDVKETFFMRYNKNDFNEHFSRVYEEGYDEVQVEFDQIAQIHEIEATISEFIGFMVVDQTKNKCVIRCMTDPREDEFKNIFKRNFSTILMIADAATKFTIDESSESTSNFPALLRLSKQLTLFCKRYIKKKLVDQSIHRFSLAKDFERITKEYGMIYHMVLTKKVYHSEDLVSLLEETKKNLRESYKYFYGNNKQKNINLNDIIGPRLGKVSVARLIYESNSATKRRSI